MDQEQLRQYIIQNQDEKEAFYEYLDRIITDMSSK